MRHQLIVRVHTVVREGQDGRVGRVYNHNIPAHNMADAMCLKNALEDATCSYHTSTPQGLLTEGHVHRAANICIKVYIHGGGEGLGSVYVPVDALRDFADTIEHAHQEVETEKDRVGNYKRGMAGSTPKGWDKVGGGSEDDDED